MDKMLAMARGFRPKKWRGLPVVLLLVGLVFLYTAAAFSTTAFLRLAVPGVSPAATSLIAFGAVLTQRTIFEEREKRRIRGLFSGFISPDRLETLLAFREDLWRHRKGVDATVLFVDIRGFSAMVAEMMELGKEGEVVEFLNTYLNTTVQEVVSQGGTVERLMGDGLLAVFGAPVPHDQHALQAVRAGNRQKRSNAPGELASRLPASAYPGHWNPLGPHLGGSPWVFPPLRIYNSRQRGEYSRSYPGIRQKLGIQSRYRSRGLVDQGNL